MITLKPILKGSELQLSENFNSKMFDCHCESPLCQVTLVDPALISGLEQLIEDVSEFKINSAFRCAAYNAHVGGKLNSQHTLGKAADLSSEIATPREIKDALERIECFANGGLGLYDTFVHGDVRLKKARWGIK